MKINLHIDRLTLSGNGFSSLDTGLVQAVLESELKDLFAEGGIRSDLIGGAAWRHVRLSDIQTPAGGESEQFGREIARVLYAGIAR